MRRKKVNLENINTLLTALMPRMDSATRRQIHSLISLVISALFITMPFTPIATANQPITIQKIIIDVDGQGPGGSVTAAGQKINYQINVTNSREENLTDVNVTDPLIDNLTGPIGSINNDTVLQENETWIYTGDYTVTQEDMNSNGTGTGAITNNATVYLNQEPQQKATAPSVPIEQNANCSIEKTILDVDGVPGGDVTAANETIDYQVNVTNNGNVDLYNVTVTDSLFDITDPTSSINNDTVLNVGESWIYTGNYTVSQEDINNNGTIGDGYIINNASVICNCTATEIVTENMVVPHSEELGPKNATAASWIVRNPSYSIFKSVINPDERGDCIINSPGDEIPYRIVVKNEGNVDLTNVIVNDTLLSLPDPTGDDNSDGVLNPGETWIYDVIYTLTSEDIVNGNINNNATVVCDQLPEKSSSVDTPVDQNADLSIYKSVTGIDEDGDHIINNAGDIINYQIAVKNNGNIDLTGISIDDPMLVDLTKSSGDHSDIDVLNPGETWIYTGDYTVTQANVDDVDQDGIGSITNIATVRCDELPEESSSIELPIIRIIYTGTDSDTPAKVNPVADFSTSVTSGYAPLTVQFTDKSTASPTSWSWDFNNDGVADSSVQSPVYTYTTPGTYVSKLTVSNANGSNSKPVTITVLQTSSSNGGGSSGGSHSGGSVGTAVVSSSDSTADTSATANITQPENSNPGLDQNNGNTPANTEQTPEPKATTTPTTEKKKTPGFEIITGVTALLGAIYLYRRR